MSTFSSFICHYVNPILSGVAFLLLLIGVYLIYKGCSFWNVIPFIVIGCFSLGFIKFCESRSLVDAIVVSGLLLGVLGIWETVQTSKESLDKTYHALYPQDFGVGLSQMDPFPPSDSEIHEIRVTKRNIDYEQYGFHVRIKNSSPQFPAQNVFVRVFFEEGAFIIAEQEYDMEGEKQERMETSTNSEKILKAIRKKWSKPSVQLFTVDPLTLEPRITGEAKAKNLIGIAFVLPVLWNDMTINNYLPIEVSLSGDNGLIAIMANENKFIFRYSLEKG